MAFQNPFKKAKLVSTCSDELKEKLLDINTIYQDKKILKERSIREKLEQEYEFLRLWGRVSELNK